MTNLLLFLILLGICPPIALLAILVGILSIGLYIIFFTLYVLWVLFDTYVLKIKSPRS